MTSKHHHGDRDEQEAGIRVPLTSAQRGIWYAQQLDPSNATYQIGQYLDLRGALDQRLVRIALNTVVADLDALSMRVRSDADGPYGVIVRPRPTDDVVQVVDLRHLDPEAALSEAMASMDRAMETPRDLQGDDLFGAVLFQITDTRSLLFQRVHHLLLDGYSAVIALRYMAEVYTRLSQPAPSSRGLDVAAEPRAHLAARQPSVLPGLDELHRDIAEYEASAQRDADEAYWRGALDDDATVAGLEGTARSAARSIVRVAVPLDDARAARLTALGRDLPKTVVAIVALYMAKITGRSVSRSGSRSPPDGEEWRRAPRPCSRTSCRCGSTSPRTPRSRTSSPMLATSSGALSDTSASASSPSPGHLGTRGLR